MAGPHPQRHRDQMVTRLPPVLAQGNPAVPARPAPRIRPGRPPFETVILDADGKLLLRLTEKNGFLDAEYDPERVTEAAQRFLHHMLQWSGQIGLPWKDAVAEAAEQ